MRPALYNDDVVGGLFHGGYRAIQVLSHMLDGLFQIQPGDFAIRHRNGTTGKDLSLLPFLVGQCIFGIVRKFDLASQKPGFARAAVARLAAEWVIDTPIQCRFENCFVLADSQYFVRSSDTYLVAHGFFALVVISYRVPI